MAVAATVNAMPTLEQTKKVETLVMDLMREDQNALKSGKKTRAEVAESAMALAEKAETEAAKPNPQSPIPNPQSPIPMIYKNILN